MEPGLEAVLGEGLPLLPEDKMPLPLGLGFSSETPLFPTGAICALTDSQRILSDGAYSSHGLREESSHADGGLFLHRGSVFTSAAGPSSLPH